MATQESGTELTIMIMPMEHPKPGKRALMIDADGRAKGHDHVIVDNPQAELKDLRIIYHHWLIGELSGFGKDIGHTVHVRFLRWDRALTDLTVTYRGKYDIAQMPSSWTAYCAKKGFLAQQSFSAREAREYPRALQETCKMRGKPDFYAVPWHLDARALWYRKALTSRPDEMCSVDGFRLCLERGAKKMRAGTNRRWNAPLGMGASCDWDVLHSPLNWAFSGDVIEESSRGWKAVFGQGTAMHGMRELWRFAQDGLIHFVRTNPALGEVEWMRLAEGLVAGEFDAVIGGLYMRTVFERGGATDILAAPLPQIQPGYGTTFLGGSHLALTSWAATRGNDLHARELIKRLTSKQCAAELVDNTDAIPARSSAYRQLVKRLAGKGARDLERRWRPYPSIPEWARLIEDQMIRQVFWQILDSVARMCPWIDVEAQLSAAALRIDQRLRKPTPPPPATLELWRLDLDVVVTNYTPIIVKITVSGEGIRLPPITLGEPYSALFVECLRRPCFPVHIHTWITGRYRDPSTMGREIRKAKEEFRDELTKLIKRLPSKWGDGEWGQNAVMRVAGGEVTSMLVQTFRSVASPVVDSLTCPDRAAAVEADPGSDVAWNRFLDAGLFSADLSTSRWNLDDYMRTVRWHLLRCVCAGDHLAGTGSRSSAAEEYDERAGVFVRVIDELGWGPTAPVTGPPWTIIQGAIEPDCLQPLVGLVGATGDWQELLFLVAIAHSNYWQSAPALPPELQNWLMGMVWFSRAANQPGRSPSGLFWLILESIRKKDHWERFPSVFDLPRFRRVFGVSARLDEILTKLSGSPGIPDFLEKILLSLP